MKSNIKLKKSLRSKATVMTLVLIERPAICPSTLYPKFQRYISSKLRFTNEEAEVRNYYAISVFLTLYPNYIALY